MSQSSPYGEVVGDFWALCRDRTADAKLCSWVLIETSQSASSSMMIALPSLSSTTLGVVSS